MDIRDFLSRLRVDSGPNGKGEYMCRCPAHDDKNASLCVRDGEKGIVLKCQAGCDVESVVSAMGLKMRDLFHEQQQTSSTQNRKTPAATAGGNGGSSQRRPAACCKPFMTRCRTKRFCTSTDCGHRARSWYASGLHQGRTKPSSPVRTTCGRSSTRPWLASAPSACGMKTPPSAASCGGP